MISSKQITQMFIDELYNPLQIRNQIKQDFNKEISLFNIINDSFSFNECKRLEQLKKLYLSIFDYLQTTN